MKEITEVLERLRATNSSTEKLKILEETKSDNLKHLFKQAYDPFITYGVSKVDVSGLHYDNYSSVSEHMWFTFFMATLLQLSRRELTGNKAKGSIRNLMQQASEKDAQVVLLTLKKDLRIGAGSRLINKVYADLLPEDFCMSANKYSKKKVTYPVYADTKLDGVRCVAIVGEDTTTLFSRNGKEFANYTTIESEIKQLNLREGAKLDGEITMGHFQDLMRTVSRRDDGIELAKDAIYNVFDMPNSHVPTLEFKDRLFSLKMLRTEIERLGLKHIRVVTGKLMQDEAELLEFYQKQLEDGEEGIMIKTLDGLYEFKRGWGWQKMKPECSDDLEIVGTEEGRGKYEGQLGVFICQLENGGTVRVGSGLKDEERLDLWNKREELISQLIEVKYQEKTKDGSLRFPIFIRFRPDKS